jgi:ABC-type multidrug transport system fused ATPase/permease subunit
LFDIIIQEVAIIFNIRRNVFMLDLLKYIRPYRKQAVIAPIFKMFEAILEIMIPTIMVLITDKGIKSGDNHYILAVGALMLLMAVLGVAASFTCQYNSTIVSYLEMLCLIKSGLFPIKN